MLWLYSSNTCITMENSVWTTLGLRALAWRPVWICQSFLKGSTLGESEGVGKDRKKGRKTKERVGKKCNKNQQQTVKGYNSIVFLYRFSASNRSKQCLLENQHELISARSEANDVWACYCRYVLEVAQYENTACLAAHSNVLSYSFYLLGLHSHCPLALRGASRWTGSAGWPGCQYLVHLGGHHVWDELAVLSLVITNQLHRRTHNLDEEDNRQYIRKCVCVCVFIIIGKMTWFSWCGDSCHFWCHIVIHCAARCFCPITWAAQ